MFINIIALTKSLAYSVSEPLAIPSHPVSQLCHVALN